MNRICIWLLAVASAVCLCMLPRTGTDAAKLLPAQVLVIEAGDGAITVEADNGAAGSGPTLAAALADMAECAEGTLFLDTAEPGLASTFSMSMPMQLMTAPPKFFSIERSSAR